MTTHAHPPTNGTPVWTKAFRKTMIVLESTITAGDIAAIYGPPGTGKSRAVDHFIQRHPAMDDRPWYWLQMSYKPAPRELTARILAELGGRPGRATQYELTETVLEHLTGSGAVLVIDEAHHLKGDGLQTLRYLHDRRGQSFSLVLIGSTVNAALSEAGELRSRVSGRVEFAPLEGRELLEMIKTVGPSAYLTETQLLEIDGKFGHGNFRNWTIFTNNFNRYATGKKKTRKLIAEAALAATTGGAK